MVGVLEKFRKIMFNFQIYRVSYKFYHVLVILVPLESCRPLNRR